jgi:hypothetical protein
MHPRDRGLAHIEYLGPDLLGNVIAFVSTGHDKGFAQGKLPRTPRCLNPRLFEQFGNAYLEFVELLEGQA